MDKLISPLKKRALDFAISPALLWLWLVAFIFQLPRINIGFYHKERDNG
jgi:hypothetical protein